MAHSFLLMYNGKRRSLFGRVVVMIVTIKMIMVSCGSSSWKFCMKTVSQSSLLNRGACPYFII